MNVTYYTKVIIELKKKLLATFHNVARNLNELLRRRNLLVLMERIEPMMGQR